MSYSQIIKALGGALLHSNRTPAAVGSTLTMAGDKDLSEYDYKISRVSCLQLQSEFSTMREKINDIGGVDILRGVGFRRVMAVNAITKKASILLAILFFSFAPATITSTALADNVTIPSDDLFQTKPGKSVIIYGQRGLGCLKKPPSFRWVKNHRKVITTKPIHGILSDGGVGSYNSKRCGYIKARAIKYIPDKGFIGNDTVVFWDKFTIVIMVRE